MKHGNTETGSGTAFPRPYFRDCISGTAVPRSRELGLHFRDHRNRDFILNITEAGSHFFNYENRIKFLISRNRDCISDITVMRRCVSARANKNNSKHGCSGAQATVVLNQTQNGGNQHARCLWGRNANTAD